MALRGTLKDFGIADIFQLIGHQTKSGRLILKNRDAEIRISFREGNIVRVESTTRQKKELLGHILVRAEIINDQQLEEALDNQKRSLRRLGDILVTNAWVNRETLNQFTRLQATETIYRLFSWQSGTYEFEQTEPENDPEFGEPMRAESVLMEGFRMVDEWPMIRKNITGYGMTFMTLMPLPEPVAEGGDDIDDAFGEMDAAPKKKDKGDPDLGTAERRIYDLIRAERSVQALIDLSRIGEFETCKALSVLLTKGYIKALESKEEEKRDSLLQGALVSDRDFAPTVVWSIAALVSVMAVVVVAVLLSRSQASTARGLHAPSAMTAALLETQRHRLADAIEALHVKLGRYPDGLDALVEAGLVDASDLVYPTGRAFQYRKTGDRYELVPPLP